MYILDCTLLYNYSADSLESGVNCYFVKVEYVRKDQSLNQEKEEKSKEIDEALSEMFDDVIITEPAPLLEDTLKKNRSIQLGAIEIKASEGSEISIKSLRASDLVGVNNSSSIVIDKVEDGMLFGVKVCF